MQKPAGYEETRAAGDYIPVDLGGHYMIIKQVAETKSKNGKEMIVVLFDFDKNDRQAGYMQAAFDDDDRAEKKWPRVGTQYILTTDSEGKCNRSFKSFIRAVEKSNGFEMTDADWDNFTKKFRGKKVGGVFGEVENEYNGKTTMRHELRWFCESAKAPEARTPDPKYLERTGTYTPTAASGKTDADGFMNIPSDVDDDEIPF